MGGKGFMRGGDQGLARADKARDRGDWRAAADGYAAVLADDPSLAGIWVQYGHALKESGRYDDAAEAYARSLALLPDEADTHLNLGHLRKLRGNRLGAAQAYYRAMTLRPELDDALRELEILRDEGLPFGQLLDAPDQATTTEPGGPRTAFDLTDLIVYLRRRRSPTGIQRVQIELLRALLDAPDTAPAALVCYAPGRDAWVEVSPAAFRRVCGLVDAPGEEDDDDWRRMIAQLRLLLSFGRPFRFKAEDVLVNLGTAWTHGNYLYDIERLRARIPVRFVPFVHDLIPLVLPGHHTLELAREFAEWTRGVLDYADGFLVNSQSTARDLAAVADRIGSGLDGRPVQQLPLSGDLRRPAGPEAGDALIAAHGLAHGPFVLMVSTLEPRKNHAAALAAWTLLIERHGLEATPRLVLVGAPGWLGERLLEPLADDPRLADRVVVLPAVSDAELYGLYRHCTAALYPSLYEGWGLPITEALCAGKPVIASRVAAHPEAGGDLADYVDPHDPAEIADAVGRLVFDLEYRGAREAEIAARFRPAPWADLAVRLDQTLAAWRELWRDTPPRRRAQPRLRLGAFYALGRNQETQPRAEAVAALDARASDGWSAPQDWGSRLSAARASLGFTVDGAKGPLRVAIGLRGLAKRSAPFAVAIAGAAPLVGEVGPGETRWVWRDLAWDGERLEIAIDCGALDSTGEAGRGGVGVIGLYLCAAGDPKAWARFAEAVQLGGLDSLRP